MTFDLPQILASKRAFRRTLAVRDITEKLQMLDALRERALTLRAHRSAPEANACREDTAPYGARMKDEGCSSGFAEPNEGVCAAGD